MIEPKIVHQTPPVKIKATATVSAPSGGINLSGYPLLAHVIKDGRHAVVTEDKQVDALAIAVEASLNPNLAAVAAQLGTTEAHVTEAIRYTLDNKMAVTVE